MPRQKRSSAVLEKADKRAAAIRAISEALDLGGGLTLANYMAKIEELRAQVTEYNTILSNLDRITNEVAATERALSDLSELMLLGVATKYGKNSNEYEMAGGIRKMDRKRPVRTKSTTAA